MKAGEKNYLKESNGTKANCNANVTQVRKSRIYNAAEKIRSATLKDKLTRAGAPPPPKKIKLSGEGMID